MSQDYKLLVQCQSAPSCSSQTLLHTYLSQELAKFVSHGSIWSKRIGSKLSRPTLQICGRYMLHPHNEEAREQHSSECQARHDRLAALRHSQGVECCVCLERVLDKPSAAERKFGLLSCDHAFCLGCIRGWRSHHEGGADTDTVSLHACACVSCCSCCRLCVLDVSLRGLCD